MVGVILPGMLEREDGGCCTSGHAREGGWWVGGTPCIPPGQVGSTNSVIPGQDSPAPWVHHGHPHPALVRCHRHGGIGVHSERLPGSVLEYPMGERLLRVLRSSILLRVVGDSAQSCLALPATNG